MPMELKGVGAMGPEYSNVASEGIGHLTAPAAGDKFTARLFGFEEKPEMETRKCHHLMNVIVSLLLL